MSLELKITTEFDNRAFVPGDRVKGRVEWEGGTSDPQKAEVRLFYYTAGKGTRDVEVADSRELEDPGISGSCNFDFALPMDCPPSFSGKLTSLLWAIEFQMGKDGDTAILEIVVSPTGEEINLYAYDKGDLPSYSDFSFGAAKPKKQKT